jgi:membrane-associated phospholipid phosphatase
MVLFCAYSIWPYLNKIQKAAMILIIFLTGIGRISLGMHFPSDIIYGYLISIIVIIFGNLIYKNLPKTINHILYNIFNIFVKAITEVKKQ